MKGLTMQLTDIEATAIKAIFTDWQERATTAEEALFDLEQLINGGLLPCDKCGDKIDADILGMCVDCSNEYFSHEELEDN
jgi:hypothetical protein